MIRGTKNIAVCLPQAMGVMNVLGAIVTTECKIGGAIEVVTDEEMIEETTGHVIASPQKIAADPIACSGMSKGTLMPTQGKSVARTHHEEMIGNIARKGHHKHRAMMRPGHSTACLCKSRVTFNIVTSD